MRFNETWFSMYDFQLANHQIEPRREISSTVTGCCCCCRTSTFRLYICVVTMAQFIKIVVIARNSKLIRWYWHGLSTDLELKPRFICCHRQSFNVYVPTMSCADVKGQSHYNDVEAIQYDRWICTKEKKCQIERLPLSYRSKEIMKEMVTNLIFYQNDEDPENKKLHLFFSLSNEPNSFFPSLYIIPDLYLIHKNFRTLRSVRVWRIFECEE